MTEINGMSVSLLYAESTVVAIVHSIALHTIGQQEQTNFCNRTVIKNKNQTT